MNRGTKAMSAMANPFPEVSAAWSLPDRGKVAMAGLIIAESAIFTIFVVAYLFYVGKSSPDRLRAKCSKYRSSTPSVCCRAA